MEHLARRNGANYPVQSPYFNLQKQKAMIYTSERKKQKGKKKKKRI